MGDLGATLPQSYLGGSSDQADSSRTRGQIPSAPRRADNFERVRDALVVGHASRRSEP